MLGHAKLKLRIMKAILVRLIGVVMLIQLTAPATLEAFTYLWKLEGDELKSWLERNKIKLTVNDYGTSCFFVITCPPSHVKELEWAVDLELKTKSSRIAEVQIKPRIVPKGESKQLEGWLAFGFTVAKDYLEESRVMMFPERKEPVYPWSPPGTIYSIKLKDLWELSHSAPEP